MQIPSFREGQRVGSFHVKLQHLALFEPTFEMVVDVDGAHAYGRSRIENVARLQGEPLRDIGNQFIHPIEHIARTALLNGLAIDVKMEMNGLNLAVQGRPFSLHLACRSQAVKSMPQVTAS